jgi:hypothetical protein
MKYKNNGQWFEQEPTESEMEHRTLGDEPIYLKAANYVPNPPNLNDEKGVKLPGISLRQYYRKKKK